jgi:protein-disulfide isomerase
MNNGSNLSRTLVIYTVLLLGVIIGLFTIFNMGGTSNGNKTFEELPYLENQPTLGNPEAKVSIVEFGDYKCPACKAWGEQLFPLLQKEYIGSGKVKFSYVNVLFHGDESRLASLAAESVYSQDKQAFWTYHKELFDNQPEQNHDDYWVTNEILLKTAATYTPNIDLKKLEKDIQNQSALSEVNKDEKLVQQYRIEKTPSIMINGIMLENPFDYEQMKEIIEKELGKGK